MESTAHEKGRFVGPLPDDLVCLICHSSAKDAHKTTCCGKICAGDLEYRTFAIKTVDSDRRIRALKVACDKKESGCGWTGELGELEEHLSTECMFTVASCPNNCSATNLLRRDLDSHRRTECPHSEYACPRCGEAGQYLLTLYIWMNGNILSKVCLLLCRSETQHVHSSQSMPKGADEMPIFKCRLYFPRTSRGHGRSQYYSHGTPSQACHYKIGANGRNGESTAPSVQIASL